MIFQEEQFSPFLIKMQHEGLPDIVIENFRHYYQELVQGNDGFIRERDIRPVESLPDLESLPGKLAEKGHSLQKKTAVIKLNGGLGTSMGLNGAKSLLKVKNGLTFLDVIALQALHEKVPLLFMNSFATHEDTLKALERYPWLSNDIPLDFLQHKVPKVTQQGYLPAEWPSNPALEWCPPGHGDIYTALLTTGIFDTLLENGYQYAFVSNSDNLGAVMNRLILGYCAEYGIPFLMEVAARTEEDRKGGHLAQYPDGQLLLRESAQCAADDRPFFQDISRHKYFNTNNLWIHLPTLRNLMREKSNILGLPLIRNAKSVDPRDPQSTPVYQLETAMGAAISIFAGARALKVPRTRFLPVKTTNELFVIHSNAYMLSQDYRIVENPDRETPGSPLPVCLDPRYYKHIDQLEARFPHGIPSLIKCERVRITGDFRFGSNVIFKYAVDLINESEHQKVIADGMVLKGSYNF